MGTESNNQQIKDSPTGTFSLDEQLKSYRQLDIAQIRTTIERLERRISERFPGASLALVAKTLNQMAERTEQTTIWIATPIRSLRFFICFLVALIIVAIFSAFHVFDWSFTSLKMGEVLQISEAALNELIFISAALFFLGSIETRVKRSRALAVLHELRSIAHIIDMHQLTKDPHRLFYEADYTASSPTRMPLSKFQLGRYLDYCSELLSVTGKLAAVYAESFRDPVALSAVNEIEDLTTALSQKVWQKVMILTPNITEREVTAPNPC